MPFQLTTPYQSQFKAVQYAQQSQSPIPSGGITYPGTGSGGGGFSPGITYPGSSVFNTTYPSQGGGGGYNPGTYSGSNNTLSQNINVAAGSRGVNNVTGQAIPDLSYADPQTLLRLNISDLIYNPAGGGYRYADSHYLGNFGSNPGYTDPRANQRASAFYNYIGSLPTRPVGTPALNQFYQSFGGGPQAGPSYNTMFSNLFNNANPFTRNQLTQAGFGSTYQGPYAINDRQNFGTNRFGLGY